jgi:hypothetical protein
MHCALNQHGWARLPKEDTMALDTKQTLKTLRSKMTHLGDCL